MNNRKILLIGIILSFICISSISSVFATDDNNDLNVSGNYANISYNDVEYSSNEQMSVNLDGVIESNLNEQVSSNVNGGNLADLDNAIKNSDDGYISLNGDIQADSKDNTYENGIVIDKTVIIEGNNHQISLLPYTSAVDSRGFYVSGDLTLKNLKILNGHVSSGYGGAIYVAPGGKLTLQNVTFDNAKATYGSAIYNLGSTIVKESTFKNMNTWGVTTSSIIYTDSLSGALRIYNSIFKDNENIYNIYTDKADSIIICNSTFVNNMNNLLPAPLIYAQSAGNVIINSTVFKKNTVSYKLIYAPMSGLNIASSLFEDNEYGDALISMYGGYIDSNVFVGNNGNDGVIIFNDNNAVSVITNNYFGVNDVTGKVVNAVAKDNIQLNIAGGENIDYNNLTVAKDTYLIAALSGNTEKLPVFSVNIGSISNKIKVLNSSVILKDNLPVEIWFKPIKSGNDSIVIGSSYKIPLISFNLTVEDIILKNYTMNIDVSNIVYGDTLNIKANITDIDGNPVSGNIEVKINDKYYNLTLADGKGDLQIKDRLSAGNYSLNATFRDTTYFYNDASSIKSFNIAKANLNPLVYVYDIIVGQTEVVTVSNLPSDLERSISIVLSGKGGETEVVDGVAKKSFSDLSVGSKGVSISYYGDNNYNSFKTTAYFYVSKESKPDPIDPPTPDPKPTPTPTPDPDTPDDPNPDVPDVPTPSDPDTPSGPSEPDTPSEPVTPVDPFDPFTPDPDTPENPGSDGDGSGNSTTPNNPNEPTNGQNSQGGSSNSGSSSNSVATASITSSGNSHTSAESNNDGQSDAINSNNKNAQLQNAFVGYSNNNVASQASAETDGANQANDAKDDAKAYEIDNVTKEITPHTFVYGILALMVAVLLLFVGYRRHKSDN